LHTIISEHIFNTDGIDTDNISNMFALRNILEQRVEYEKNDSTVNFIEVKKVFVSVHRPAPWKMLRHYGISEWQIIIFTA